ncbi:TniQ family protein [Paucibacter sp. KCTC 42545]|uniref:TniQ family protein n=1 Tax=Paucibacter sp. KCTC 42545 TaxID=1768242 RepID=UPI0012E3E8E0
MWAFHLRPAPQELLSSYLTRVAHGHGSTAGAFCRLHLNDSWYWTRDVDRGVAAYSIDRGHRFHAHRGQCSTRWRTPRTGILSDGGDGNAQTSDERLVAGWRRGINARWPASSWTPL